MSSYVALVHIVLLCFFSRNVKKEREREGEIEIERYVADIHTYIHDI